MTRIALTVNGRRLEADVPARTTLADLLREEAGARSVHLGCEHGVCGACTVVVDGMTARSCIALAASLDGADVRTLEGLADDPATQALKDSFSAEHALQCGYCTPAMLIAARDILERNPDPGEDEIRDGLAGQICRCTGYAGIVRAIRRVADSQAKREATSDTR